LKQTLAICGFSATSPCWEGEWRFIGVAEFTSVELASGAKIVVSVEKATAKPRHHPLSSPGLARPFPALLYVARKKGEKCMLQAYVSSVQMF
jgi:hypothetical protein